MDEKPWLVMNERFEIVIRGTLEACQNQIGQIRRSNKTDTFCIYAPYSCHTSEVTDKVEFYEIPSAVVVNP